MTAKGRLNTAWIFSLLLVLAPTTSLGHIHCDHMPAKQCAVCAFGDQTHMLAAPSGQPAIDDKVAERVLPSTGIDTGAGLNAYLSRAPPLA